MKNQINNLKLVYFYWFNKTLKMESKERLEQSQNQKKASQLHESVFNSIEKDISKNEIQITAEQKQVKKHPQKSKDNTEEFHRVHKKRKELQDELAQLKFKEKQIKKTRKSPMQTNQQNNTKYFRSTITEAEKTKIKKIIYQRKNFEKKQEEKTEKLLHNIAQIEEEQKQEEQKEKKQKELQKKKIIEKNLENIEARKVDRAKSLKHLNRNYQTVTQKKFLHESIQQKWKTFHQKKEEDMKTLMQKNRKQKKFDITEIKKHQRRYSQILARQKDERLASNEKFKDKIHQFGKMSVYPRSTFFNTITEEDKTRRKKETDKMKQSHVFYEMKQDYSRKVHEKNMRNSPTNKEQKLHIEQTQTRKAKDYFQIYKQGNKNMKEIHSYITEIPAKHTDNKQPSPTGTKYRDYLTQHRLSKQSLKPPQTTPLTTILQNPNPTIKHLQAKQLLQRLEQKPQSTKNLLNSIRTKLAIIEQLG